VTRQVASEVRSEIDAHSRWTREGFDCFYSREGEGAALRLHDLFAGIPVRLFRRPEGMKRGWRALDGVCVSARLGGPGRPLWGVQLADRSTAALSGGQLLEAALDHLLDCAAPLSEARAVATQTDPEEVKGDQKGDEERDELRAEVTRLRTELEAAQEAARTARAQCRLLQKQMQAQSAEQTQLRARLRVSRPSPPVC
jgi:hypothetical protein